MDHFRARYPAVDRTQSIPSPRRGHEFRIAIGLLYLGQFHGPLCLMETDKRYEVAESPPQATREQLIGRGLSDLEEAFYLSSLNKTILFIRLYRPSTKMALFDFFGTHQTTLPILRIGQSTMRYLSLYRCVMPSNSQSRRASSCPD